MLGSLDRRAGKTTRKGRGFLNLKQCIFFANTLHFLAVRFAQHTGTGTYKHTQAHTITLGHGHRRTGTSTSTCAPNERSRKYPEQEPFGSHRGRLVMTGGSDNTVRLWDPDATPGRCVKTLAGHTSRIWSLASDAAGRHIASASGDGVVKLWDVSAVDSSSPAGASAADRPKLDLVRPLPAPTRQL